MELFQGYFMSALLKVPQQPNEVNMKTEERDYVAEAIENEERNVEFLRSKLKELKDQIKFAAARQRESKEAIAILSRATSMREGGSISTAALASVLTSGKKLVNNTERARADLRDKLKKSRTILAALKVSKEQ